jgi:hypothetical protein
MIRPRRSGLLYPFVSLRDLFKRDSLCHLEAGPPCIKGSVQILGGCRFCLLWEVVTAQEEDPRVLEYHRPERRRASRTAQIPTVPAAP